MSHPVQRIFVRIEVVSKDSNGKSDGRWDLPIGKEFFWPCLPPIGTTLFLASTDDIFEGRTVRHIEWFESENAWICSTDYGNWSDSLPSFLAAVTAAGWSLLETDRLEPFDAAF